MKTLNLASFMTIEQLKHSSNHRTHYKEPKERKRSYSRSSPFLINFRLNLTINKQEICVSQVDIKETNIKV